MVRVRKHRPGQSETGVGENGESKSERDVSRECRREKQRGRKAGRVEREPSKERAAGARARGRDSGVEKCGCARKVCWR